MPDSSDPIFKGKWDRGFFSPLSASVVLHSVVIVGLSGFLGNWGAREFIAAPEPEVWVEVVVPEETSEEEEPAVLAEKDVVIPEPEKKKDIPSEKKPEKKKQEVVPVTPPVPVTQVRQEAADVRGIGGIETYTSHVLSRINRNKFYPPYARQRHEEGDVILSFHISRGGDVEHIRIVKSSQSHALDSAAIEAVKKSVPFDAPPSYLSERDLDFRLPVRYVLKGR